MGSSSILQAMLQLLTSGFYNVSVSNFNPYFQVFYNDQYTQSQSYETTFLFMFFESPKN